MLTYLLFYSICSSNTRKTSEYPDKVTDVTEMEDPNVEDDDDDEDEVSSSVQIPTRVVLPPSEEENSRCKICFKTFDKDEFFRICSECIRRVCDDCSASYGKKEQQQNSTAAAEVRHTH